MRHSGRHPGENRGGIQCFYLVIPAKTGIQKYQIITKPLDSGFHRSDDFRYLHDTHPVIPTRHTGENRYPEVSYVVIAAKATIQFFFVLS